MIRLLFSWLIISILAFTEISLAIWFDWVTPHLVLAGLLALCLAGERAESLWWVGLGGLLLDVLAGSRLGLNLILLALVSGSLLWLVERTLPQPSLGLAGLIFALYCLGYELILMLVNSAVTWQLLGPSLLTTLLATGTYYLIRLQNSRREILRLA